MNISEFKKQKINRISNKNLRQSVDQKHWKLFFLSCEQAPSLSKQKVIALSLLTGSPLSPSVPPDLFQHFYLEFSHFKKKGH